jgi:17beta-estradiol 17-dehydrogenase / very-long-chain 3-oxoacyl-CoA reductase
MDSKLVIPVFAVLGALVVLRVVLLALHSIYAKFLRPGKNLKKFGDWAVVTGATGMARV